jgi:hypothetical protein
MEIGAFKFQTLTLGYVGFLGLKFWLELGFFGGLETILN